MISEPITFFECEECGRCFGWVRVTRKRRTTRFTAHVPSAKSASPAAHTREHVEVGCYQCRCGKCWKVERSLGDEPQPLTAAEKDFVRKLIRLELEKWGQEQVGAERG